MLFKRKKKIEYDFEAYIKKQTDYFTSLLDTEEEKGKREVINGILSSYDNMLFEYRRYKQEYEYLERRKKHEG